MPNTMSAPAAMTLAVTLFPPAASEYPACPIWASRNLTLGLTLRAPATNLPAGEHAGQVGALLARGLDVGDHALLRRLGAVVDERGDLELLGHLGRDGV